MMRALSLGAIVLSRDETADDRYFPFDRFGRYSRVKSITIDGEAVTIGAMTTQHELITNEALARAVPLIREASLQIADPQVRYMGTIGGNVANGDPANDMPGLIQTLDATYHLTGPDGNRTIQAREFYEAAYFTAREDDEILTAISFDAPSGGYAYEKQKRKIGDYAILRQLAC